MAEYGKSSEVVEKTEGPKPLYKKTVGLCIAIGGGLTGGLLAGGPAGGLFGLISSPIFLLIFGNEGETVVKDISGKDIKVGVWAKWMTTGLFVIPAIWVIGVILSAPTKPPEQDLAAIFQDGKGDLVKTGKMWMEKHELSGRWGCEGAIKEILRDPSSMESRDVSFSPASIMNAKPPIWLTRVRVIFGARNGFGGMNIDSGSCLFDINGTLIKFEGLQN